MRFYLAIELMVPCRNLKNFIVILESLYKKSFHFFKFDNKLKIKEGIWLLMLLLLMQLKMFIIIIRDFRQEMQNVLNFPLRNLCATLQKEESLVFLIAGENLKPSKFNG